MKNLLAYVILLVFSGTGVAQSGIELEKDIIKTSEGDLEITFINHGTLMMSFKNIILHIDPVAGYADYSKLPKADIILITHHHGDHLNEQAVTALKKADTKIVLTETCYNSLQEGTILANGDQGTFQGIKVEAVPAYNLQHKRDNGEVFHPKGIGNGYVINFGDVRVYIGGDTENFPEMKSLKDIDIAFLPMNLPYTMTPDMVADAVDMFNPKILYPYHFGSTDTNELIKLLKDHNDLEVRIRKMN